MRQGRYLNVILTVNAVLLSVLIWTQLGHAPMLSNTAEAQSSNLPNAAEQRMRMIETLREVRASVNETNRLLDRGTLRVHVANAAEIRPQSSASDDQ